MGRFVIDIVRDDLLIDVQTSNFSSIKEKLAWLVKDHRVLLVYPVAEEKYIVRLTAAQDEVISRRKSPKKGRVTDLFDELVRIPALINDENLAIEVVIIREEEIRCEDGKGSWRRKGVSILDQELTEVLRTRRFANKKDLVSLLPDDLEMPFTNRELAESAGIRMRNAGRMTYCLRQMGAIDKVGKRGRAFLLEICDRE